ncbi:MAG TPA: DUF302 domain-containing protein [Nocardioidaceae bacterium]|jgi:uncharacterized protein (DUF302 family)|nr:DUF302 domain-containing protein [Nocardioidaceae bacterium]
MSYTLSRTLERSYDEAVKAVREALAEQGFGVLTEIDLAGTLKQKLDVDLPPQVILGACRPPLAHAALQADPSIGALLPCNVVVRALEAGSCRVEILDPATMVTLAGGEGLQAVADEAKQRLQAALDSLPS